jgi:ATP-dependent helicase Lhr and Lhr-like helicase
MSLSLLHPAVKAWFEKTFDAPTTAQLETWSAIKAKRHTLVASPTGSGKTLAAFLAAIDDLTRQGLDGRLQDGTQVLYVSPLKALSSDIRKNLDAPLAGIRGELLMQDCRDVLIRAEVRTGDTPQSERVRMRRQPPHILVTTPESLYILLTSDSGRSMLTTTRTVIVDEIHALAGNKRGAHLTLSLERLQDLCQQSITRVGLSATQKPIETLAKFLTGADRDECTIVDSGHMRARDLAIEVPGSPLEAIMAGEVWGEIYDRLATLVEEHRTTLIFVNTRRLAERLARHLGERIGDEVVTPHHGSLAREHRLNAEQRLKNGQLRALVATASLELGIDIGEVDLVCQIGSSRAIGTFLQRVGRSGHAVLGTPKGRLFPLSRDELVECAALLAAVRRGELDALQVREQPLDVLAQQLVAEVSCREWPQDDLFALVRRAWPYHDLKRGIFDALVIMLAQGFSTRRGQRSTWLHHDAVNKRLRARKGARLTAIMNGGAIPDQFDCDVVLQPEGFPIGTLAEDFAFDSTPGDIFQLGNTSYRILKVETSKVHVEDAKGQPPNIPFWFGEAPGRSRELSMAVSVLRAQVEQHLIAGGIEYTTQWLLDEHSLSSAAATQLVHYLGSAHAALGKLPTQDNIVFERFFDEAGDQHLVVHAPFGSRLNRAWGLALRKRFCRKFNFELQAAALEDSIVLSLGAKHSFLLAEVADYLKSKTVRDILIQAVLDVPLFATRWRWNASIALAVRRNRSGGRVPPQFQRMDAEDLVTVIFPDQLACAENLTGKREVPDHPLVEQTLADCLHEAMDIEGLEVLLQRLERGEIKITARDLTGPSPLAQEVLSARPYAFLDDAPAEERRTQMVQARSFVNPEDAADLGRLDMNAIEQVRAQAWPQAATADELHDALMLLGFIAIDEVACGWPQLLNGLIYARRATVLRRSDNNLALWVCAERLRLFQAVFPDAILEPPIEAVGIIKDPNWTGADALVEIIRARLQGLGPVTVQALAHPLGMPLSEVEAALLALEAEGFAMRGEYTPNAIATEWCERGLLARIHRYTIKRLREAIQPVPPACFMRFLCKWQGVKLAKTGQATELAEGEAALAAVLAQLEGFEAPASAWEAEILPARLRVYSPGWLDNLCAAGRVRWVRLTPPSGNGKSGRPHAAGPVRNTPIALVSRAGVRHWREGREPAAEPKLSSNARRVLEQLERSGALFFDELVDGAGLLRTQLEQALAELAASGLVSSDSFAGLRALLLPASRRRAIDMRRRRRGAIFSIEDAGRWSRVPPLQIKDSQPSSNWTSHHTETVKYLAGCLLRRYGIVFRALLLREDGLPPWRELLYVYRRMEARGEVRGGRFVSGFAGEQFALPEAVGLLREINKRPEEGELIAVSAADPLNLVGSILPGARVPALTSNRILYRDGVPVATYIGKEMQLLENMDGGAEWQARTALLRRIMPRYASNDRRPDAGLTGH